MLEVLEIIQTVDGHVDLGSMHMASGTEDDLRRTACCVLRLAGKLDSALPYARPLGMAIGKDGLLYVSSRGLDSVLRLRLPDGGLVDELALPRGVMSPHGLAFGSDGSLFVSSEFQRRILQFNCVTGKLIGKVSSSIPNPVGLAFRPPNDLFVACNSSTRSADTIHRPANCRLHCQLAIAIACPNRRDWHSTRKTISM